MFQESEYEKVVKTVRIENANKTGLVLAGPVFFVFTALYVFLWEGEIFNYFRQDFAVWKIVKDVGLFFIVTLVGIVFHELIHGISFAMFTERGFRSIRFGVLWKYLTPYCHCTEPLQIRHYRFGALAPAVILGLIPAVAGLVIGKYTVTFFGIIFIVAAIGDFMVIQLLWKEKPTDYAQDHPSEAGCFVFRKK